MRTAVLVLAASLVWGATGQQADASRLLRRKVERQRNKTVQKTDRRNYRTHVMDRRPVRSIRLNNDDLAAWYQHLTGKRQARQEKKAKEQKQQPNKQKPVKRRPKPPKSEDVDTDQLVEGGPDGAFVLPGEYFQGEQDQTQRPKPPVSDPGQVGKRPEPPVSNPGKQRPEPPVSNPGKQRPEPPVSDPGQVGKRPEPPVSNPGKQRPEPPVSDPGQVPPPPESNPGKQKR